MILVDFWERRKCPTFDHQFHELAVRVEDFIKNARSKGVRVIHALAGVKKTTDLKKYENIIWLEQDARPLATVKLRNKFKRDLKKINTNEATLDFYPPNISKKRKGKKGKKRGTYDIYCDVEKSQSSSALLHPEITVDMENDVMFDAGSFFERIARELGAKRLFYAGSALNRCVLYTRPYSAVVAYGTKKFESVNVLLDLTIPKVRQNRFAKENCSPGLKAPADCALEFADWLTKDRDFNNLFPDLGFYQNVA